MSDTYPDLFGGESRVIGGRTSRKELLHYRKAFSSENCSNCKHSYMQEGNTKNYRKCKLIGNSASESSDVSRNCTCVRHEMVTI